MIYSNQITFTKAVIFVKSSLKIQEVKKPHVSFSLWANGK